MVTVACSNDTYETGDGEYSYMRADFCEMHTTSAKTFSWAVSDDLDTLHFVKNVSAEWALKADSAYRALLYYNISGDKVTPVSISRILVPRIVDIKDTAKYKTDPLTFESSWLSRGGHYLNLGLYIKIGKTDTSTQLQKIGVRRFSTQKINGKYSAMSLLLTHDQNNVPEYYSQRCYVSIPLDSLSSDAVIDITINTYDGAKTVYLKN